MSTTYSCPVIDCTWTHTDTGPQPLPGRPGPDEQHAQNVLHDATVEHAIRAHYETHDADAWARTVQALHAELAARNAPMLCAGCLSEQHEARQAGAKPPPPLNPVQVIVGGTGSCLGHLSFGAGPQIPGRTRGGLILGGPGMPGGRG